MNSKLYTKKINNSVKKGAKDLNRYFIKEDMRMTNRHVKTCSISVVTREMQI